MKTRIKIKGEKEGVMKGIKLCVVVFAAAGLICLAGQSAWANYHSGASQMICSDCHAMHTASASNALNQATVTALCIQSGCHDGAVSGTTADPNPDPPDVMGTCNTDQEPLDNSKKRAAGNFAAAVGTNANGHNLEAGSTDTAPGGTWTSGTGGLTCSDCHNPHGTTNYRNLITIPGTGAGTAVAVTTDVAETATAPTATQYSLTNLQYKTKKIADWCAECHTNYHETTGNASATNFTKHPSGVASMGGAGADVSTATWAGLLSRTKVMDPDGIAGNTDDIPICITCHKAHGTSNADALIYDDGTSVALEDGSAIQYTCNQCHGKF